MGDDPLPRLVRIPAGEFVMGCDDGHADERPAHKVHLDEFFFGAYPVTNDEYAQFVQESGHRPPSIRKLRVMVAADRETEFRDLAEPFAWADARPPAGRGDHPV